MLRQLLNIERPLIQAPMAGAQGHALAAAVTNAGGLGSLPCAMLTPEAMRSEISALRAATGGKPFNVNFFCHRPPAPATAVQEAAWRDCLSVYYSDLGLEHPDVILGTAPSQGRAPFGPEAFAVLQEHRPAVVSFHFGLPPEDLLRGIKVCLAISCRERGACWQHSPLHVPSEPRVQNPLHCDDHRGGIVARGQRCRCNHRSGDMGRRDPPSTPPQVSSSLI